MNATGAHSPNKDAIIPTLKARGILDPRQLADAANPEAGPSTVRYIGHVPMQVLPGNPMRNDPVFDREGHTLWIGGFPAASVLYGPGNRRADGTYTWGWIYHSAHTCTPHGPFNDLEALLDHAEGLIAAPLPSTARKPDGDEPSTSTDA